MPLPSVMPPPELWWARGPRDPRAVVMILHGGAKTGTRRPLRLDPSVMRGRLFAGAIARAGRRDGLRVEMLRYRMLGWNDGSPVDDARWALDDLERRFPGRPVALLGHSMGGRTALRLVSDARVRAVVTAATWVEPADLPSIVPHPGLTALVMHGRYDRLTSPRGSAVVTNHLRTFGTHVATVGGPDGHAMLRHARMWHREAGAFLRGALG